MKNHFPDLAVLLGRFLIALLFLGGAVQKAGNPDAVIGLLAAWRCCWPDIAR
ncbi:hypothetical protein [Marinovum sp. 1_MG-2023]|uniref:hypothetical protein n=1 Tax=Marinovum sp. 1_MG-2023 TaxID=3062633 RepID=UPI003FA5E2AB